MSRYAIYWKDEIIAYIHIKVRDPGKPVRKSASPPQPKEDTEPADAEATD